MATQKDKMANLIALQSEIIAKKDKFNSFGKYAYRTAEGILADVKPIANKYGYYIKISDKINSINGVLFLEATAELINENGESVLSSTASAIHQLEKRGMDAAQLSGATSSYARKYALCGLFAIDDGEQDIDAHATHGQGNARPMQKTQQSQYIPITQEQAQTLQELILGAGVDIARFLAAYNVDCLENFNGAFFDDACYKLKQKLQ